MTSNLQDTEDLANPHLMWEIVPGAPLLMAFTGQARGLNELANFEFVKSTRDSVDYSKIFVRDPQCSFYHFGIGEGTSNVLDIRDRLQHLIQQMNPPHITCLGVSAGGFAALLFGHLLKADLVHAIGPQVNLYEAWGIEHDDVTITRAFKLHAGEFPPEHDFRDLSQVLSVHNGKTTYKVHIGERCREDWAHAKLLVGCPGVELVKYECDSHACASNILRQSRDWWR